MKRYNIWLKLSAFILAVALAVITIVTTLDLCQLWIDNNYEPLDALTATHYTQTSAFTRELSYMRTICARINQLQSEEHIKSGATVTRERLEQEKENLFNRNYDDIMKMLEYGPDKISHDDPYAVFERAYAEEIANIPETLMEYDLSELKRYNDELMRHPEVSLAFADSGKSVTSGPYVFEQLYYESFNDTFGYITFSPEYIGSKNSGFQYFATAAQELMQRAALLFLGFLLCLAYLVYAAGRRTSDKIIKLLPIDRLYNEFTLCLFALDIIGILYCCTWVLDEVLKHMSIQLQGVMFAALVTLWLTLFLMLVRHIKNRTFFRHTLIYTVFSKIFGFFRRIYLSGRLMQKAVVAVILLGFLTMIPFVGVITVPLAVWVVYKKVKAFNVILDGVEQGGTIDPAGTGEFRALAEGINGITDGLEDEVQRRLKAERLRTELISNVSHDIRTPLTSLITYVDLLKNEPTDNENIQKYTEVLEQKASRLKTLTDDLFEASKASSGNIPVNAETVDIVSLVTQGLGELDDKIRASGLDFKLSMPEKLTILSDGRLLWRVLENLIGNTLKYSQENTRVYLSAYENRSEVRIEIKNISKLSLNIPEEELFERFKRGDESRTDAGSGLGLAIARSLTEALHGQLNVKIDGDLFKATISMPTGNKTE